jgi:hypothetical protein
MLDACLILYQFKFRDRDRIRPQGLDPVHEYGFILLKLPYLAETEVERGVLLD